MHEWIIDGAVVLAVVLVVLALRGATLVNKIAQTRPNPGVESEAAMSHEEHKLYSLIDRIARDVLEPILGELRAIRRELKPKPLTRSIAVRFSGDLMSTNALVFAVGQTSQASIQPLLADGLTPSGGVLSNVVYTFSDPSATVVLNADGLTATCTGVAASTGAVSGSASCTVTDTDGVVSTWTQPFTITTSGAVVPPAQLTQSVAVQFTDPGTGAVAAAAHAHGAAGVSFPSPLKKV